MIHHREQVTFLNGFRKSSWAQQDTRAPSEPSEARRARRPPLTQTWIRTIVLNPPLLGFFAGIMLFVPISLPDLSKPKFSRSNRRKTKIYTLNFRKHIPAKSPNRGGFSFNVRIHVWVRGGAPSEPSEARRARRPCVLWSSWWLSKAV